MTNIDDFVFNVINQVLTKFQDFIQNLVPFVLDDLAFHYRLVIKIKDHYKLPNFVTLELLLPIKLAFKCICFHIPLGFIKIDLTWKFGPIIVIEVLSDIFKIHVGYLVKE
jgi:hypothetical protein